MADENSINGRYKHKKLAENSWRTGGEFHVDSASYPRVMSGGMAKCNHVANLCSV